VKQRPIGFVGDKGQPARIDTTVAHASRIYDYMLGGTANFAVDREAAQHLNEVFPGGIEEGRIQIRANRDFLVRAVRHFAGEGGIRQFLDIGTGVPNADNVPAAVHEVAPGAPVVCVDNDPVVLAHAHQILRDDSGVTRFIEVDVRKPQEILRQAAATLDFSQPVGLTLVAILHVLTDDEDPYGIMAQLVDALAPGSHVAISHVTADINPEEAEEVTRRVNERSVETYTLRDRDGVARFLDGLEILEPGVVPVDRWRSEPVLERGIPIYGAVGRKP
jgi:hypothetical protein